MPPCFFWLFGLVLILAWEGELVLVSDPVQIVGHLNVDAVKVGPATAIAPADHPDQRIACVHTWSPGHQGPTMVTIAVIHTALRETLKQLNIKHHLLLQHNQLVFLR